MDTAIYAAARKYNVALDERMMQVVKQMAAQGKAAIVALATKTKARTDADPVKVALALSLGRIAWDVAS